MYLLSLFGDMTILKPATLLQFSLLATMIYVYANTNSCPKVTA